MTSRIGARLSGGEAQLPLASGRVTLLVALALVIVATAQYNPQARSGPRNPTAVSSREPTVVRHGPNGAEKPLVYNHVAKTGGSFVKNVLIGLFGMGNFTIIEEWQGSGNLGLDKTGPKKPFILAAKRAPCDYYLSLWAFTSGGIMDRVIRTAPEARQFLGEDTHAGFYTPQDVARFRKWVKAISSEKLNVLTNRFWFSYFRSGNPCMPMKGEKCAGEGSKYEGIFDDIDADLRGTSSLEDVADCWIRTENLEDDLKACLEQYEGASGVPIDWASFARMRRTSTKNKSNRGGSCEDFYDNETKGIVLAKDHHVVRLFGYDSCCSAARKAHFDAEEL